METRIWCG